MNHNLGHDENNDDDDDEIDEVDDTSRQTQNFRLKESQLRKRLEEKPNKNAKLMSTLALHLAQRSQELASEIEKVGNTPAASADARLINESKRLQTEAIMLAERAIQTAPQKPFGYAALSNIYPSSVDYSAERMTMLEQAISCSEQEEDDKYIIALIGLLVRQLLEPRELEARKVKGKMGKASKQHPSRRPLSAAEETSYQKLKTLLTKAWGISATTTTTTTTTITSEEQTQFLVQQEYKLGLFFRKKDPVAIQVPRARHHLTNCITRQCSNTTSSKLTTASPSPSPLRSQSAMARFWLGTLGQPSTSTNDSNHHNKHNHHHLVSRCPPEYIVGLYSTFADRFDELLVEKLDYQTPTKLRQLFDQAVVVATVAVQGNKDKKKQLQQQQQHRQYCCLDLGCGTGISGLAFQDVVCKMDGVDLSPEMIAKARERNCYDSLKVADVVDALLQEVVVVAEGGEGAEGGGSTTISDDSIGSKYDLILACDVFCYIGDLSTVFASVKRLLSSDGFFCFSTELLRHHGPQTVIISEENFRLHSCARFSHTEQYILELAKEHEFEIVAKELADCLRTNQGANVEGMLTILKPRQ